MKSSTPGLLDRVPLTFNEVALLVAIVLAILLTAWVDPNHSYVTWAGISYAGPEIARNMALLGIFALGALVVIISGGIDLSSGSMIAFSATVFGCVMVALAPEAMRDPKLHVPHWVVGVAMGGSIFAGLLVGTLHAWLITAVRLPPFVATLATLVGLRSFARILLDYTMRVFANSASAGQINFYEPVRNSIMSVPVIVTVFAVLSLLTWLMLSRTVLGRHIYALGGNEQAARLSGIRTDRVKWFAYCFASVTASIAGILYMASEGSASPSTQATGHELYAIAAAVVGGCSLQGGVGTVLGTVLGALFLRVIIDAVPRLIPTGSEVYEGLIVGIVVVIAVAFSQLRQATATGRQLLPGALGWCAIPVLAMFAGAMVTISFHRTAGVTTGLIVLALLVGLKLWEVSRARGAS
jgi:ribose/xylose/arabinose/galactoside ABC-type transport system permease subunit